jgi:PAS domain S-box-containing protein
MPENRKIREVLELIADRLQRFQEIIPEPEWNEEVATAAAKLASILKDQFKHKTQIEKQIDEFNDILLRYAHHNYRTEVKFTEEDDVFNSLAMSIQLLGEELNHSTITKNFLEDIFNSMTDLLIVVDAIGYINSVNSSTLLTLKYTEDELVRGNIRKILPENTSYRNFLVEATKKGTSTLIASDGSQLPVSLTISPFVRGDDQQIGNVIIARDISPMLRYQKEILEQNEIISKKNEEMNHAIQKIEESEKLKTAFLQNVSHEIRTPLNSILGLTNVISTDGLDPVERKEIIELIEKSGKRLVEIINNILDISKIETGQYQVSNAFFPLNELMKDLAYSFSRDAAAKNLEFEYHCDIDDGKDIILSDKYVIRQALNNLINNAIKFSDRGSVAFGYKKSHTDLDFYVRDTGIGISPQHQAIIFNRFIQVDFGLSRIHEGAGLGLPITKGLIELLGGKIWIESDLGKGSTFHFTIPYQNRKSRFSSGNSTSSLTPEGTDDENCN